jgi:hypothetical protein
MNGIGHQLFIGPALMVAFASFAAWLRGRRKQVVNIIAPEEKEICEKKIQDTNNLRGKAALLALMRMARYDTSPLSNSQLFLEWCRSSLLARMQSNREFKEKIIIRNIRKANLEKLKEVDDCEQQAKDEWKSSYSYDRFEVVSAKRIGIQRAIESMEQVLLSGAPETDKTKRIRTTLLPSKLSELHDINDEYDALCDIPAYREMMKRGEEAMALRRQLGLIDAKKSLANTQKEIGHRKREGGYGFEDIASDIIQVS